MVVFERFFLLLFILPADDVSSSVDGFLPPVCWGPSRFLVGTGILANFPVIPWCQKIYCQNDKLMTSLFGGNKGWKKRGKCCSEKAGKSEIGAGGVWNGRTVKLYPLLVKVVDKRQRAVTSSLLSRHPLSVFLGYIQNHESNKFEMTINEISACVLLINVTFVKNRKLEYEGTHRWNQLEHECCASCCCYWCAWRNSIFRLSQRKFAPTRIPCFDGILGTNIITPDFWHSSQ